MAILASVGCLTHAQTYDTNGDYVETFAGSGFSGYLNGTGQLTMFDNPNAIVADSNSNLFVWDSGNYRIRKITQGGTVSTFAGGGSQTAGYGTNISLNFTYGFDMMTIDHSNAIWIAANGGTGHACLYCIQSNGYFSGVAITNGLLAPAGLCVDSANNVYVSDLDLMKIYRYSPSNATWAVFAGSGNKGYADGSGIFTAFSYPGALAVDAANNIYVWDSGNYLVRKIDQNQNVTTYAGKYLSNVSADGTGTSAVFNSVFQMCVDGYGNLIVACGLSVREINPKTNVVTMAGSFTQTGYTNGTGNIARFDGADGVCISGGTIFVGDYGNQRIRDITFNPQPQVVSGANLGIGTYSGVTITGVVGRTYQIQSSPNMSTWTTRATVLLNFSPYLWLDQNPVSGNKFYRAMLLP